MFLDLGYSREDAQNLILRSELMSRIERYVRSSVLSQKDCAARMGVTQPRLNDLLKAKIDKFNAPATLGVESSGQVRYTGWIWPMDRDPTRASVSRSNDRFRPKRLFDYPPYITYRTYTAGRTVHLDAGEGMKAAGASWKEFRQ